MSIGGVTAVALCNAVALCSYSVESEGWESVSEEAKDLVRKLLV